MESKLDMDLRVERKISATRSLMHYCDGLFCPISWGLRVIVGPSSALGRAVHASSLTSWLRAGTLRLAQHRFGLCWRLANWLVDQAGAAGGGSRGKHVHAC